MKKTQMIYQTLGVILMVHFHGNSLRNYKKVLHIHRQMSFSTPPNTHVHTHRGMKEHDICDFRHDWNLHSDIHTYRASLLSQR